ncbi:unnamed protein product [Effrenium voratum]|nr:unnamed protein product [Effrenium voratum]
MRLWLLPLLAAASGALEEVPEVPEVPEAPEPPEPEERAANYSLSVESCRRYVLEVSSHGPGFYQDANLHRYTRCLFVLRWALPPARVAKDSKKTWWGGSCCDLRR